jgi:pimeloyl-ACP methyl ester carboxylesterase
MPLAVKSIIGQFQSEVWPDIVYTLGSKPEELQAFIKLAKENPGAAIRKAVLTEHLITQELSKGGKPEAKSEAKTDVTRDESGKFQKAPEKEASPYLGGLRAPTLILIGSGDIADNQAVAGALVMAIPGAARVVVSDAGHLMYLEKTEVFSSLVSGFLKSHGF